MKDLTKTHIKGIDELLGRKNVVLTIRQIKKLFGGYVPDNINKVLRGTESEELIKEVGNDLKLFTFSKILRKKDIDTFITRKREKVEIVTKLPESILKLIPDKRDDWKYLALLDYLYKNCYSPESGTSMKIPISNAFLEKMTSKQEIVKKVFRNLGVIEVDDSYCVLSNKSKRYKISDKYLGKNDLVEVIYKIRLKYVITEKDKEKVKTLGNKEYGRYILSKEWRALKKYIKDKRGHKCELCQSTDRLEVHHLHYDNLFNEKEEDLMVLCRKCHEE